MILLSFFFQKRGGVFREKKDKLFMMFLGI